MSSWHWLDRYRLHEATEITSRNKASLGEVLRAVLMQQTIQTALGWWWLQGETEEKVNHIQAMATLYPMVSRLLGVAIGTRNASHILAVHGPDVISAAYWWILPVLQFILAMSVLSLTWERPSSY